MIKRAVGITKTNLSEGDDVTAILHIFEMKGRFRLDLIRKNQYASSSALTPVEKLKFNGVQTQPNQCLLSTTRLALQNKGTP